MFGNFKELDKMRLRIWGSGVRISSESPQAFSEMSGNATFGTASAKHAGNQMATVFRDLAAVLASTTQSSLSNFQGSTIQADAGARVTSANSASWRLGVFGVQ